MVTVEDVLQMRTCQVPVTQLKGVRGI